MSFGLKLCAAGSVALLAVVTRLPLQGQSVEPAQVSPPVSDAPRTYARLVSSQSTKVAEPQLILSRALDPSAQREMIEDLQVMDNLLLRAIGGESLRSNPYSRVLGLMVSNRDERFSRVQFIQDVGVIFRYNVVMSVAPQESQKAEESAASEEVSDWDAARRQLFSPKVVVGYQIPRPRSEPYNEEIVDAMSRRVIEALRNVDRIRHIADGSVDSPVPGSAFTPRIIVVVSCPQDGTVKTFQTTLRKMAESDETNPAAAVTTLQYHQEANAADANSATLPYHVEFGRQQFKDAPTVQGQGFPQPPSLNQPAPQGQPFQPVPPSDAATPFPSQSGGPDRFEAPSRPSERAQPVEGERNDRRQ
jgi:hypothetical protein